MSIDHDFYLVHQHAFLSSILLITCYYLIIAYAATPHRGHKVPDTAMGDDEHLSGRQLREHERGRQMSCGSHHAVVAHGPKKTGMVREDDVKFLMISQGTDIFTASHLPAHKIPSSTCYWGTPCQLLATMSNS
jgi:hypothetical protein